MFSSNSISVGKDFKPVDSYTARLAETLNRQADALRCSQEFFSLLSAVDAQVKRDNPGIFKIFFFS